MLCSSVAEKKRLQVVVWEQVITTYSLRHRGRGFILSVYYHLKYIKILTQQKQEFNCTWQSKKKTTTRKQQTKHRKQKFTWTNNILKFHLGEDLKKKKWNTRTPLREELFCFSDLQFENLSKLNQFSSTIRFLMKQMGEVCFFSLPTTSLPSKQGLSTSMGAWVTLWV